MTEWSIQQSFIHTESVSSMIFSGLEFPIRATSVVEKYVGTIERKEEEDLIHTNTLNGNN